MFKFYQKNIFGLFFAATLIIPEQTLSRGFLDSTQGRTISAQYRSTNRAGNFSQESDRRLIAKLTNEINYLKKEIENIKKTDKEQEGEIIKLAQILGEVIKEVNDNAAKLLGSNQLLIPQGQSSINKTTSLEKRTQKRIQTRKQKIKPPAPVIYDDYVGQTPISTSKYGLTSQPLPNFSPNQTESDPNST